MWQKEALTFHPSPCTVVAPKSNPLPQRCSNRWHSPISSLSHAPSSCLAPPTYDPLIRAGCYVSSYAGFKAPSLLGRQAVGGGRGVENWRRELWRWEISAELTYMRTSSAELTYMRTSSAELTYMRTGSAELTYMRTGSHRVCILLALGFKQRHLQPNVLLVSIKFD